jgi:hypothetical protein
MEKINNEPKPEIPNEEMTFKEFYQDMKQEIINILLEIYERKDENLADEEKAFFNKYGTFLANAMVSSIEAGEYFEGLIPGSMKKPEKKYESSKLLPSIVIFEKEKLKLAKKLNKTEEFNQMENDFQSDVYEEEKEDGIEQTSYNRFWKNGKRVFIEEIVKNFLKNDTNVAISNLVITDFQSSARIDLGHLLPERHMFVPSKLLNLQKEYDEEKNKIKNKFYPVNLKEYTGAKNSEDAFYHFGNFENVYYGDIVKKGGMLALFHEIAHAWQQVYQGKYEKGDFDNFYLDSVVLLDMLEKNQLNLKDGKINQEKYNSNQKFILDTLKEKGVEIDINNFIFDGQELEKGSLILTSYDGKRYVVRCKIFADILSSYEKCERDAWAHALLMLKFLRKKGIDLEPEMKNSTDIKEYIEPCLDSYQKSTEQKVEIVGGRIAFLKRK